jgi:hypothetical protein
MRNDTDNKELKEEEERDDPPPTQRYLERGPGAPLDSSLTAEPKSPLRSALGVDLVTKLPFTTSPLEFDTANMPTAMAGVLLSLRTSYGSFEGGGFGFDGSNITRILWENLNLFRDSERAGIRALGVQRCRG